MEIIAQFIENLNSLENLIYIINTYLEPLLLNKTIPNKLKTLMANPELTELMNSLNCGMSSFNKLLTPIFEISKTSTYKKYPLKQQPYANFIID